MLYLFECVGGGYSVFLAAPFFLKALMMEQQCHDFTREIYCIAGLPFDAVDLNGAVSLLQSACKNRTPCFLSTPNLNWMIACQTDSAFRGSVIHSDLSVVDGMPLVWMAKLLGIPIRERVSGASLFEALLAEKKGGIKVFFFGGPDGVAKTACNVLNEKGAGLECAGYLSPGFVSNAEMSTQAYMDAINASGADFVVVALGARKGQEWIECNRSRIHAPVISHLGAVVNFAAGSVSRAPYWMQSMGLEWLWRIVEEPALWKRYWSDGLAFLKLLFTQILPYAFWIYLNRRRLKAVGSNCISRVTVESDQCRIAISGVVSDPVCRDIRDAMQKASLSGLMIAMDLTDAQYVGPGFLGLLLLLKKKLDASGLSMQLVNANPEVVRIFEWNGVDYLLKGKHEC